MLFLCFPWTEGQYKSDSIKPWYFLICIKHIPEGQLILKRLFIQREAADLNPNVESTSSACVNSTSPNLWNERNLTETGRFHPVSKKVLLLRSFKDCFLIKYLGIANNQKKISNLE